MDSLVEHAYGSELDKPNCDGLLLSTTNAAVNELNKFIGEKMPGKLDEYNAYDKSEESEVNPPNFPPKKLMVDNIFAINYF